LDLDLVLLNMENINTFFELNDWKPNFR